VNRMMTQFLTHRTKSKFVFAGPSKSAETLIRFVLNWIKARDSILELCVFVLEALLDDKSPTSTNLRNNHGFIIK